MEFIINLIKNIQNIEKITVINILIAVITIIIFYLFSSLFSYIVIKLFSMKSKNKIKDNIFYKPLKIFFLIFGIYISTLILDLPESPMNIINKIFKISIIILVASAISSVASPIREFYIKLKEKLNFNKDDTITVFICKIIKMIIYIIAGFLIISEIGYDLNGIITGLGLGSVVVAFAAQDIAKNLFGGFAIIIDKPFIVGDFINIGNYNGIVEDITFRSTKIRTSEDSIITIPNSVLSNQAVINWSKLTKRRYSFNIDLKSNIKIDKIKEISDKIIFVIKNNPNVEKESVHVSIDKINIDSISIFISVYTNITNYYDYLLVKESINCSIIELLENESIELI